MLPYLVSLDHGLGLVSNDWLGTGALVLHLLVLLLLLLLVFLGCCGSSESLVVLGLSDLDLQVTALHKLLL